MHVRPNKYKIVRKQEHEEITHRMTSGLFTAIAITGFTIAFLHAAIPNSLAPLCCCCESATLEFGKNTGRDRNRGQWPCAFHKRARSRGRLGWYRDQLEVEQNLPPDCGWRIDRSGPFHLVSRLKGSHGHVHLFGGPGHHEPHQHHDDAHLHGHHAHDDVDRHDHHEHDEIEEIEHKWSRPRSDWAVIAGLVALLTFSPCEAFLPVFLTGARYGWLGFALLSGILAIATVAGMIVFTWLTLLGLQRFRFEALEKYESMTVGMVFCLLGLIIILFEH